MRRIAKGGRRYGRDNTVVAGLPSTHKIAIGFNAGVKGEVKPGKTNGFLIFLDTLDKDNKLVVDYDAMARLGYGREMLAKAMAGGFAADESLLPKVLRFVLMADGVMDEAGQWAYPGTYAASYECYNKAGLWCAGDGANAVRKQDDGSKKLIECIPYGRDGAESETFCKYSGPDKPCKLHLRLTVCLYYYGQQELDGDGAALPGARPRLVSPALGYQARYRFDTSSEYCDMGILEVLDSAANRVRGRLNGITGTLTFTKRGRRTGKEQGLAKSITGFVVFQLDEHSIRAREQQIANEEGRMFDRQIEAGKAGVTLQLPPPVALHDEMVIEADATARPTVADSAADPFDAPAVDAPDGMDADYQPNDVTVEAEAETAPPVPTPKPVGRVARASDADLVLALGRYAERNVDNAEDPKQIAAVLNGEASIVMGKPVDVITVPGWFLRGDTEKKDTARRKLLRDICAALEASSNPAFSLALGDGGGEL